jgi:tRNA threonylcarbamoyl adenosine modification protein (Sua5/YciO/YrdC/YwlC family)
MPVEIQRIYAETPHQKQINHAAKILKNGGVVVYPTDTIYGLAADIYNKSAIERIFKIKKVSNQKLLSLIFPDLKQIADWVHVPNNVFRTMKRVLPGKYTFVLPASKEVPKSLLKKRRTMGIRVPDNEVSRRLVEALGNPLVSTSVPKGEDDFFTDPDLIADQFMHEIDLILDAGVMPNLPSTVVDYTTDPPEVIREGAGDVDELF